MRFLLTRFLGSIQEANNEQRSVIRYIILEEYDFCSIKCIYEYMQFRLENAKELV